MLTYNSEIFSRAVEGITTLEDLKEKLKSGKKLRIKFGVDVTASTLHIGNAVNLWKMRSLQEYGHKVIFLIGDFTTKIGDPTGRLEVRRATGEKNVNQWAKNFIKQIGKILLTDQKTFEVRRNSEWFGRMKSEKLLELMSLFTHAQVIEREMFQRRLKEGKEIRLPELIYPVLQGYDSVMLESDLTVIGSDQLFNEGVGRFLQQKFGQRPQVIVTTTITPGLDGGVKMSKSLGNYIGLEDAPTDKFGKAMRLRDALISLYLKVYTETPLEKIVEMEERLRKGGNPMEAKLFFAEELVARYHGRKLARKEKERFLSVFSKKKLPEDMPTIKVRSSREDVLEFLMRADLAPSKTEARRLLKQGAIKVNGVPQHPALRLVELKTGSVIQVGKRKFVKLV